MSFDYPLPEPTRPLPWHAASWEPLHRALERDRLAHAILLSGMPGTGRNDFALALARALLCAAPMAEGPCGACRSCELTRQGAHADLRVLAPAEPGKSIGIDAVRAVLGFATSTSALGLRKAIIVTPLEAMTISAFNAFLKLLEEPPPDTHFILVHARGRRVPATIRSRCQQIQLPSPEREAARHWLREQLGDDECDGLDARLDVAGGQPVRAAEQAHGDEFATLAALRAALAQVIGPGDIAAVLAAQGAVAPLDLLEQLEQQLHAMLDALARHGERDLLRAPLAAAAAVQELRGAYLSGSNPNTDLLRFTAIDAFARACEAARRDGKLPAT